MHVGQDSPWSSRPFPPSLLGDCSSLSEPTALPSDLERTDRCRGSPAGQECNITIFIITSASLLEVHACSLHAVESAGPTWKGCINAVHAVIGSLRRSCWEIDRRLNRE
jgi:hypothetical protein